MDHKLAFMALAGCCTLLWWELDGLVLLCFFVYDYGITELRRIYKTQEDITFHVSGT
jgi:hypothetical protein